MALGMGVIESGVISQRKAASKAKKIIAWRNGWLGGESVKMAAAYEIWQSGEISISVKEIINRNRGGERNGVKANGGVWRSRASARHVRAASRSAKWQSAHRARNGSVRHGSWRKRRQALGGMVGAGNGGSMILTLVASNNSELRCAQWRAQCHRRRNQWRAAHRGAAAPRALRSIGIARAHQRASRRA
jgi:hypothetical protein